MTCRKRRGSPWRSSSAWRWVLALSFSALSALPGTAQSEPTSPEPTLTALLRQAESHLTTLSLRLQERTQQVNALRESLRQAASNLTASEEALSALEARLAEAETQRASLLTDLTETQSLLSSLSSQYAALSSSWQTYRTETERTLSALSRSRTLWRWVAAGSLVAALVAGAVMLGTR